MALLELQPITRGGTQDNVCAFTTSKDWFLGQCNDYHLSISAESESAFGISGPNFIPITAKSISTYLLITSIEVDYEKRYKNIQLVEVGAGLAEFSPHMAEITTKKPIVIDPVDYRTIRQLLVTARDYGAPNIQVPTIDMLIKRIDTLLDPTKIRLYNMPLFDAVSRFPDELRGIADVVLDVCGAILYVKPREARQKVEEIENHFLSKSWWESLK